ncbi:metallophosphoesterase [candidate division KSB1 bacterium]|nr:metallophosphoesterase [candidate division KSB1 bacterium]
MNQDIIFHNLEKLYKNTPETELNPNDRVVIFSDLHLGNGGERDDFRKNAKLFTTVVREYYLRNQFKMILNGDIEELQKFNYAKIRSSWKHVYALFDRLKQETGLYRIVGNHDWELFSMHHLNENLRSAIKYKYNGNEIFLFHGHQAVEFFEKHYLLSKIFVRYITKPLRIKNISTAYNSKRKFKVEKNAYLFSSRKKIVSIIGHTHRPLFESLSKTDYLKFTIEQLIRQYPKAKPGRKKSIERKIKRLKRELDYHYLKNQQSNLNNSLYNSQLAIPCVFNSGTVIGKRGITSLEIANERIYLVHWFHPRKSRKYLEYTERSPERLGNTPYFRLVLKQDPLDYVFARIKLLT